MKYAGFWQRFGAYWIDVIVILPLMIINYFGSQSFRLFPAYWLVPGILFGLWFHVYLVKRYGGTPGKLLLNIRITMVDGSPVTLKAATLRYSVLCILSWLTAIAVMIPILHMTDELYFSLGYMERSKKIVELAPAWFNVINILLEIWIWSEFISMMFNKKRRAIHDFIAGTVVIVNEEKPVEREQTPPVETMDA